MRYEETRATRRVVRRVKAPAYSSSGYEDAPERNDYYDEVPENKPVRMRSMSRVRTEYCIACGKENLVGEQCSCGYVYDDKVENFRVGLIWGIYLIFFSFLGLLFVYLEQKGRTWKFCPYCGACIGRYDLVCAGCGDTQPKLGTIKIVTAGVMCGIWSIIAMFIALNGGLV